MNPKGSPDMNNMMKKITTRLKNTLSGIFTAAALAVALSGGMAAPAQAQNQQALQVFANSNYGYCDAKKVAAVWGIDIVGAKAVIGNKIMGNITNLVDADIASTAGRVRCSWEELQMSYNDAVVLGQFWGRQPHEAKAKAAAIATDWGRKRLHDFILSQIGYQISG